ncbi:MAG: T9SS type A sorting domain-containing protein, partial [Bacteroidota bacterium]|nr:T9SS type A sorting domain-containing protein [Bacteroidota bacterium]
SPNSNYLYHSKWNTIYQIDLSTFSQDTVAINDGFYSPYPPFQTDFWLMYLAADGKIYISSGNGVIDMHVINSPDSSGLACDVQQHSLHTPCFFVRSNVLHPNYYLGPVIGSLCDTLGLGMQELPHDFHFSVSPNPNNGNFKVSYLLPQNEKGKLEIFDITGRKVFDLALPEWSTMQVVSLPENISDGIYNCVISSNAARFTKKIALM